MRLADTQMCIRDSTQGLRQMLVDNYSVFYIVGGDAVSVARVLYSASDLVRRPRCRIPSSCPPASAAVLGLSLIHISCYNIVDFFYLCFAIINI